jgi:glycosyltransferase involved in cell wall biosynthesis
MTYRILIASDHYPPFIGGAHRQTQLLSRELHKRGHTVAVATVWHPGLPAMEDDGGVPVYRLRQLRTLWERTKARQQRHQPPYPDPVTTWKLRGLLDSFQPDLVHSYGWYTYSLAAALAGKQTPLLISARDYAYACATRTLVQRGEHPCSGPGLTKCLDCAAQLYGAPKGWVAAIGVAMSRKLLARKVAGVHSISSYVQEMVRRDAFPTRQQPGDAQAGALMEAIIPSFGENDQNLVDGNEPALQPYVKQLPEEPFILFVGALRRVKGVDQLLAAYTMLTDPPPLVLIGTYESDSPRSFPPGVHVLSDFPHRAVMAAWERALFGVIPSLWPEPLGSVVYEGMSRGKALIGTKPGGHTDMIVDGETGLLVPQGDIPALAAAMQRLTNEADLRRRLGQAAQVRAQQFTAAVNVPRFEQLYQALIEQAAVQRGQRGRHPGRRSQAEIVSS